MSTTIARLQIHTINGKDITITGTTVANVYRCVLSEREDSDTLGGCAWKDRVAVAEMEVSDADSEHRYALDIRTLHDLADLALFYLSTED